MNKYYYGFTVVELMIALLLILMLIIPIGGFVVASYTDTLKARSEIELKLENVAAIRAFADEARLGVGLKVNNSISDANKSGGWTASSVNQVLIISNHAVNSANAILKNGSGVPYKNELVYFTSGTDLYVRVLANAAATGNSAITSCPTAVATSACPADRKIVSNVKTFSYSLYNSSGTVVSAAIDARSLQATIVLEKGSNSSAVTATNKFRVSFRNSV